MKPSRFVCLPSIMIVGAVLITGCDAVGGTGSASGSGAGGGEDAKGFKIDWGSGSVEIGGDGSVDVQAPGVEVKRTPGESVSVKAPHVDVDVSRKNGVSVRAPNVDVDVQPNIGSDESARVKVNAGPVQVETNPQSGTNANSQPTDTTQL